MREPEEFAISYNGEENEFEPADSFRIDSIGIMRKWHPLLKWKDVITIKAWVTTGDSDWGDDQFLHIELYSVNGNRLYASDSKGLHRTHLLYALWNNMPRFLPQIPANWQDAVWADCHLHLKQQNFLNLFWYSWYPNKPVIYRSKSS